MKGGRVFSETRTCLNCGKSLKYHERKNARRNKGYCSMDCYLAKPPRMVLVEREYGKPVPDVILEHLSRGRSVQATAQLLGIDKWALCQWMRRFGIRRRVMYVREAS